MRYRLNGGWSAHLAERHGPFAVGGAVYAVTVNTSSLLIQVEKTTNHGKTWTVVASASYATNASVDAVLSGTTIYFAFYNAGFKVATFDTTTDTITATTAASAATGASGIGGNVNWSLAVRSNGDFVVFFQAPTELVMSTARRRFSYIKYTGGAWGAAVTPAGQAGTTIHYELRAAVLGASDRIHYFYTKSSSSTTNIFHQSISSTDVQDTEATVISNSAGANLSYCVGLPVAFTNGANTEIAIPLLGASSACTIARFNSAANPTFTTGTTGGTLLSGGGADAAVAANGTTKYVVALESASGSFLMLRNDGGTNTWSGTTTLDQSMTVDTKNDTSDGASAGQATFNGDNASGSNVKALAQSFVLASSQTISRISVLGTDLISASGSADLYFEIRADSGGLPGSLIATSDLYDPVMGWEGTTLIDFTGGVALTAGTTYWLVARLSATIGVALGWSYNVSGYASGGSASLKNSWAAGNNLDANGDQFFYVPASYNLTAASSPCNAAVVDTSTALLGVLWAFSPMCYQEATIAAAGGGSAPVVVEPMVTLAAVKRAFTR